MNILVDNYVIIDQVLDSPIEIVKFAKKLTYFKKGVNHKIKKLKLYDYCDTNLHWRGFRSKNLIEVNKDFYDKVFSQILSKIFTKKFPNYEFNIDSYFHFACKQIVYSEDWWHVDGGLLSGVIYLNELPAEKSGTLLKINNEIVELENKFNRMVVYDANLRHRPQAVFGSTIDDTRLTLSFFINTINIFPNNF